MRWTIEVDGKEFEFDRPTSGVIENLHSRALFCPFCATVWSTIEIEGCIDFIPDSVSCTFCHGKVFAAMVPGSLLDIQSRQRTDWELLDYLPDELLEREFRIHLEEYDRASKQSSDPSIQREVGLRDADSPASPDPLAATGS